MTLKRLTAATTVLLAASLAFAGCASPAASTPGSTSDGPTEGGNLIYQTPFVEGYGWHWQDFYDWTNSEVGLNILDRLFWIDPESREVQPWLASSWEANEDATVWTIGLTPDVTFSDGTPLDAQVVLDNIDLNAFGDEALGYTPSTYFPPTYTGGRVIDALTLELDFSAPSVGLPRILSYLVFGIVSESTLALPREEAAALSNQVGTGPFTLTSEKDNEEYVLTKRPDYAWGYNGQTHPAYVDTLTVQIVEDNSVREGSLQTNQAQIIREIPASDLPAVEAGGATVHTATSSGILYNIIINDWTNSIVSDTAVRQALEVGIDRQEIVDTLFDPELWSAPTSFLNPGTPGLVDLSTELAYDPDAASAILDDAGWVEGADGIREKDGERLSWPISIDGQFTDLVQLVAQQLEKIGVELDVTVAATWSESKKGASSVNLQSFPDPSGVYYSLFSEAAESNDDPALQATLDEIQSATTEEAQLDALGRSTEQIIDQGYYIPLYINNAVWATNDKVDGFLGQSTGRASFYNVHFVQ